MSLVAGEGTAAAQAAETLVALEPDTHSQLGGHPVVLRVGKDEVELL